jgi:hypothetical protein
MKRPALVLPIVYWTAMMATACTTVPTGVDREYLIGTWSNAEVGLELHSDGGRVQYSCGTGTIEPGWEVSPSGEFTGVGQHRFGGGPLPTSEHPPHRAEYRGRIYDERLDLIVELPDSSITLGPYRLNRGASPIEEGCV